MNDILTTPHVYKISLSEMKGEKKKNVNRVELIADGGIKGDAHADSNRPLSLLPFESFVKVEHPDLNVLPGDFAENITTKGVDFTGIKVGTKLKLGQTAIVEVIQIGKECHKGCIIREKVGDCIMPREGVFAKVLVGGNLKEGDPVTILDQAPNV